MKLIKRKEIGKDKFSCRTEQTHAFTGVHSSMSICTNPQSISGFLYSRIGYTILYVNVHFFYNIWISLVYFRIRKQRAHSLKLTCITDYSLK